MIVVLSMVAVLAAFYLGLDLGSKHAYRMVAKSAREIRAKCSTATEYDRGFAAALESVTKAGEKAGR